MMKPFVMCFIIIVMVLMIGCQPTPESEIVNNKSALESTIIDKTINTNIPDVTESNPPSKDNPTWKYTYNDQNGIFKVDIDTIMNIPDVDSYPVIRILPKSFSDEDLSCVVEEFFGNNTIYDGNVPLTKSEIAEIIVQQKAQMQSTEKNGWGGAVLSDDYIKKLEEDYLVAPESIDLKEIDAKWTKSDDGSMQVNIITKSDDAFYNRIEGYVSNTGSIISYLKGKPTYRVFCELNRQPRGVQIKMSEAETIAITTIKQLGLDNMVLNCGYIASDIFETNENECYVFYFTRSINGIPSTYVHLSKGVTDSEDGIYAPRVPEEVIAIYINDDGIVKFEWKDIYEEIEYVSDNVQFLDLQNIQDIFINEMKLIGKGRNEVYNNSNKMIINDVIKITKVTLGMMTIIDKDKESYLLIPVWDFFGTTLREYSDGSKEEGYNMGGYDINYAVMTINAIDGSIINRNLGY